MLFSMVDHRKNLHHEVINEFYKDKLFFKSYIPYLSDVEKMGVNQAPLKSLQPVVLPHSVITIYGKKLKKDLYRIIYEKRT